MRHVAATFHESILRRGKSLEQFLGSGNSKPAPTIRWIELRPSTQGVEVWTFEVPDLGGPDSTDVYEFGADDIDQPAACLGSPGEALAFAHEQLGASPELWVNAEVIGDEYLDYVAAGRPINWRARRA
ncbi:hypothetical protein GCM10025793_12390 [Lysobacter lycopersici]